MRDQDTSIVILEPVRQRVDALRSLWGTNKNIINAALWLFCTSEADEQLRAVQAVAELQKQQETSKNGAADAAAADAEARPRTGRGKKRSA